MDTAVRFSDVALHYGDARALDGVDLEIADGEFFGILGPSGSGKTSCLRLIAGFERPTRGSIELHAVAAENLPPYERDVNTVFQDYALFPHMSVEQNVAYGLMVKGVSRAERSRRAREMLEKVRLEGFEKRRPSELSGGQRQRVALARALVNQPSVLLLDEPLGALDLKLRQEMQVELRALQRAIGITFIFVTHDQGEALSMSDRLAVFRAGRIEQVGAPREIYERPATRFVAEFVGDSNIIELDAVPGALGRPGLFSVRPEKIRLLASRPASEPDLLGAAGRVSDVQFHGAIVRTVVVLEDGRSMTATTDPGATATDARDLEVGRSVWMAWRAGDMHRLRGAGDS